MWTFVVCLSSLQQLHVCWRTVITRGVQSCTAISYACFCPFRKRSVRTFLSQLAGQQKGGVKEMIKGSEMLPYFYSFAASSQPQGRQAYWQLELWSCKRSLDLKSVFASLSKVPQRLQWMQNKCATCCYKSLHSCQIEIPQPKKCSPTRFLPTDFCSAMHDEGGWAGLPPCPCWKAHCSSSMLAVGWRGPERPRRPEPAA